MLDACIVFGCNNEHFLYIYDGFAVNIIAAVVVFLFPENILFGQILYALHLTNYYLLVHEAETILKNNFIQEKVDERA